MRVGENRTQRERSGVGVHDCHECLDSSGAERRRLWRTTMAGPGCQDESWFDRLVKTN